MSRYLILVVIALCYQAYGESDFEWRQKFDAGDFVSNLDKTKPYVENKGEFRAISSANMPVLGKEKLSLAKCILQPCQGIVPHTVKKASLFIYVTKAKSLEMGIVEENGGRLLKNVLSTGDVILLPKELIHYQQNLACTNAEFIVAFDSNDVNVISTNLGLSFLDDSILSAAFNVTESIAKQIKRNTTAIFAPPNQECLRKCGLSGR